MTTDDPFADGPGDFLAPHEYGRVDDCPECGARLRGGAILLAGGRGRLSSTCPAGHAFYLHVRAAPGGVEVRRERLPDLPRPDVVVRPEDGPGVFA